MTKFFFIRHGEPDYTEANTRIYQNWGLNMLTLSDKGIKQIKNTAEDPRLRNAQLIVTSPFGRALHTAAILSRKLNTDIAVETDLHEWMVDAEYRYLSDSEAAESFKEFCEHEGIRNDECRYNWETAERIVTRITSVLNKYRNYDEVIIVCHGVLMQYFLGIEYPDNGQIEEYVI